MTEYVLFVGCSIVYARAGSCLNCGRCCRHVYLRDRGKLVSSFHECLLLVKADTSMRNFVAKGANENGELYFACDLVGRDNRCKVYQKRPMLCRTYPDMSMLRYGAIPKDDCGFYFINRFTRKRVT
ncbi:MAG: YkgJ family cysteine cluster protein [Candidatus Omnitrophica bacterium]|nr:YkgJ family cysteine cluster protein [Candidatus Omnitrophota bacterium]